MWVVCVCFECMFVLMCYTGEHNIVTMTMLTDEWRLNILLLYCLYFLIFSSSLSVRSSVTWSFTTPQIANRVSDNLQVFKLKLLTLTLKSTWQLPSCLQNTLSYVPFSVNGTIIHSFMQIRNLKFSLITPFS